MADFFQTGVVTTLHRLSESDIPRLENDLKELCETTSIGLVLPALYSEFETPAAHRILNELKQVNYLRHIVVALGRATWKEFLQVRSLFLSDFPQPVTVLWIDGERNQHLFRLLEKYGISAGEDGKGRSCWLAYGYLLATGDCDVIALHDCDIVNYDRQLLARLCYPVANPNLGFEFCKGYYARVTDRMHGRVTRLFMTPLVRAMESMFPEAPFLKFLDSFRYPLAGEFAMVRDLAWTNRIPGDWGLEIGVLAEVYRNCALRRICQADIADAYDHKHQELSDHNPDAGLLKMCVDITKSLFRNLASEGVILSDGVLKTLRATYLQAAQEAISRYENDAAINSLTFDRHQERTAVEVFLKGIKMATDGFLEDPLGVPMISNWSRVTHAVPDMFDRLVEAVEADHSWDPTSEPAAALS